ncbi:FAD-binding and (Fe-S)-binding domain-containing protein [Pseudooceanicola aestuarii]|uniref:FAD-binding and (Fe-S)-binding domain-containing protein n=1 Tax=Pseudooceanicola aestuarii TaxID=2697319 RepID=UPI0013CF7895|nr:FAD-binding and (Fe-S)-binding domain-containing protein [Pseudooceanicola aestuarii]
MAVTTTVAPVTRLLQELGRRGFKGQARTARAARVVHATDNSIYYREPACVLEPAGPADIATALTAANQAGLPITPRGGGTGTNGQSLTDGVVLDTSRFMNRILDYDAARGIVRVEPGVVLDQLNAFLAPQGVFFPPAVSTASRATLGGMVGTDASGKGSRRYGRTSDHLHAAEVVLACGTPARFADLPGDAPAPDGPLGAAVRLLRAELPTHAAEIARVFPVMNRGLTGYNLAGLHGRDGTLHLPRLLAGSEGTLAIITALELRVTPLPAHRGMAIIGYADTLTALGAVPDLLPADPDAVEFLDDVTVRLGKTTPAWPVLEPLLGSALAECGGYLFAEVAGDTPAEIDRQLAALEQVATAATPAVGIRTTRSTQEMAAINGLRKDAVGLMGKGKGALKGTAFVEDAAVPPDRLVPFVAGFRDILAAQGLDYGMYGHADVGCVHVRPLMDMRLPDHRARIRPVSDAVARLAREHGGLIWGEHGKGLRGEYGADYFGPQLFALMRRIKAAFDPANRLNPGKLATAAGTELALDRIDGIAFRGARDQRIAAQDGYARAVDCNGNGACFHWDSAQEMCPSYKVTRDRVQSPKGRAALMRDWLHARETGSDAAAATAETALADSLATCLSCKACTSQCPVQVDIPTMKARFLAARHATRPRPARDHLLRRMEGLTLLAARMPTLANAGLRLGRGALARTLGLVDLPRLDRTGLSRRMRAAGARQLAPGAALPAGVDPHRAVILLCDSFLAPFEPQVLEATARLLARMGLTVFHTPPLRNGKALQVRGFQAAFARTQQRAMADLTALATTGLPLVSVEPAATMLYRQDFDVLPATALPLSLDRFLHERLAAMPRAGGGAFRLIGHCTETAADPANLTRWAAIFDAAGLRLTAHRAGCCGMAGLFGHETEHREMSRRIFALNWHEKVTQDSAPPLLATGFSCRSQARRFADTPLPHPVQALEQALRDTG